MKDTTIHLRSKIQIGRVDPRIFTEFLEHMARRLLCLG